MSHDSDNPSGRAPMRARIPSGISGYLVPPEITKVADILGRTIQRVDSNEDKIGNHRRDHHLVEARVKKLEEFRDAATEKTIATKEWLNNKFAEQELKIELTKRDVKHIVSVALVVWTVLLALGGLLIHFVK